jgi:septal ring factor EnvC (AmiA/AmiB activator)
LQKTGILKTFTVAKIVKKKEIDDLKALVKTVTSDENEYKQMLAEEIAKMSNMHDKKNPIPGIIYSDNDSEESRKKMIYTITTKFSKGIKQQKFTTKELAFLISAIINELGLTQEDFQNLKDDLAAELEDEDDMDEDDMDEDYDDSEDQNF